MARVDTKPQNEPVHSATLRGALACVLLVALSSTAHGQSSVPAIPPGVKKTVDAFLGHWILTGSSIDPGSKTPSRVTGTIDCEPAAGGMAVRCRVVNAVTGGSQVEISTIVGYSPDDRQVHLMEAASSGSFHEHRGRWNGPVIQFERLINPTGRLSRSCLPAGSKFDLSGEWLKHIRSNSGSAWSRRTKVVRARTHRSRPCSRSAKRAPSVGFGSSGAMPT